MPQCAAPDEGDRWAIMNQTTAMIRVRAALMSALSISSATSTCFVVASIEPGVPETTWKRPSGQPSHYGALEGATIRPFLRSSFAPEFHDGWALRFWSAACAIGIHFPRHPSLWLPISPLVTARSKSAGGDLAARRAPSGGKVMTNLASLSRAFNR